MAVMVRCSNCNAEYETEATAAAIEEVARCQECGEQALSVAQDDEPREDTATGD